MGFDLTGLNPKKAKYKSPSNDLYEQDKDKFFKELEKYQNQEGKPTLIHPPRWAPESTQLH